MLDPNAMTTEEQMKFSQRYARFNTPPQSIFGKLLTLLLGGAFLVVAFMFSLVALAVVAVGGLMLWGWLWWKTRAVRKLIREQGIAPESMARSNGGNSEGKSGGYIIEGEAVRQTDEPPEAGKLLR